MTTTPLYDIGESRPKQVPPPQTAEPEVLVKWVDEGLYYTHPLRVKDAARWRRAELYDRGLQWLKRARSGYDEGASVSQWAEVYWPQDSPDWIPTPVFNEGFGARCNESARLGRPNYRPKVDPRSSTPDLKSREGARATKEMVVHRLDKMEWDTKSAPLIYYHMPLYGGSWWKSEFVLAWDKTTIAPVTGAAQCAGPTCDFTLASKTVSPRLMGQFGLTENAGRATPDGGVKIDHCPRCDDHPPMLPLKPTMQEAQTSKDSLGRPLGKEQPLGDWVMSVPNPNDMFVFNQGLGAVPGQITDFVHAHVETMDWVALHYPDKVDAVRPENPAALAKYHPVAGSPDSMGRGLMSAKSFDGCVRIVERHKHPFMERSRDLDGRGVWKINKGRSVVRAGKTILLDDHMMIESLNFPGEQNERVIVDYIPWEFQDGGQRLEGMSLWDIMFDPQDAENEGISQRQAVRQRMAVPMYLFLKQHNLEIQAMSSGIPGRMAVIDAVEEAPNMTPSIINNSTIDQGVSLEIEHAQRAIDRLSSNIEVEKGQIPGGGVTAAQAIVSLKTFAGEKREPRLARIKNSLRRGWKHGARLMEAMYIEPREAYYTDSDGSKRTRNIHGKDFARQTEVEVDAEPDFDTKAKNSAATRDLITLRVVDPATLRGQKARTLANLLDAPPELFEDDDLQRDAAEREWIAFKEEQRVPQVDPSLDDHGAHYETHGRDAHQEWFRDLEDRGDWDGALKILEVNWFEQLSMLAMTPIMPGGATCLQDRIVQLWMALLQQGGYQPQGDPEALAQVLQWRAHMESHRVGDETRQARAMMQPTLPAPGAPATAAGTQPTDQSPPAQSAPQGSPPAPAAGGVA